MKSSIFLGIVAIAISLTINSCIVGASDCIKGSRKIVSETRELSSFNHLLFKGSGNIFITQGDKEEIRIETDDNLLNNIITKVSSGELIVDNEESMCPSKLNIYLTTRTLNAVKLKGSGDIKSENKIYAGNYFNLEIDGSGDVKLQIDTDKLTAEINGSGDMMLDGRADSFESSINGSGDINAFDLASKYCSVNISGSGTCKVFATEQLNAKIFGSGDIIYKGNPKNVKSSIIGSGDVIKQ